jgi:HAD superfamily phosphoserine phosphatase-like hydrolase
MTRVALCDFDGTHFRETLEVSLADHLIASGLVQASAFAKSHERRRAWKRRDLTYPELTEAHWREVSEAFKGLSVDAVRDVARQMIEQIGSHVSLFMREFVKSLHACNYTVIGISGSNKETVEIFGEVHGYDRVIGTEYAREDGVYTGGVAYWPGENNKRDISKKLLEEYGASPESSIAIGDTANDFGMLQSVRYPIAFNATRELEKLVRESSSEWSRNIGMVTERKNRLRIEKFYPDQRSRPRACECMLEDMLPKDVAEELTRRLGPMCVYDTKWP